MAAPTLLPFAFWRVVWRGEVTSVWVIRTRVLSVGPNYKNETNQFSLSAVEWLPCARQSPLHSKTKLSYLKIFGLSSATRVRNTLKYPLSRLQKTRHRSICKTIS